MHISMLKDLNTKLIAKRIVHYEKIDSTQKEIWRRIHEGKIENGTVIIADLQTDAIGTHGRRWYTTEKENIAFSFMVYPNVKVEKLSHLTIEIAKVIVSIFKKIYQIELEIKVPNDIVIGHKKIGGILTETTLQGEFVKNLVIGIGLNTNQKYFEEQIQTIATSIKNEFHIQVDNEKVIAEFCNQFEEKIWKKIQ